MNLSLFSNNLLKFKNTLIICLLVFIIAFSSLISIFNVSATKDENYINYPCFRSYQTDIKDNSIWEYDIKNFGIKPSLHNSDKSFNAPTAKFNSNDNKTTVSWNEYSDANSYKLYVFNETEAFYETETTLTTLTLNSDLLLGGKTYDLQIEAITNNSSVWSKVLSFTVSEDNTSNSYSYCFDDTFSQKKCDDLSFENDKLTSKQYNTGYTFDTAKQNLSFDLVSFGTNCFGTSISFTSSKDGFYDLASSLYISSNNNCKQGTLNYHILKLDKNNNIVKVFPQNENNFESFNLSDIELNKDIGIEPIEEKLDVGEKLIIEAYLLSKDNSHVTICFGNPTTTYVNSKESYKGYIKEYPFSAYAPNAVYDVNMLSKANYKPMQSRWTTKILHNANNSTNYYEIETIRPDKRYETNFSTIIPSGSTASKNIGYYNYIASNNSSKIRFLNIGNGYGVAFQFISPMNGNATVSIPFSKIDKALKYRIMKNDEIIFPNDGSQWASAEVLTTASADCFVSKNDILSIEVASLESNFLSTSYLSSTPMIYLNENTANSSSDTVFSPLWNRIYKGKDYNGEFVEEVGECFHLDILNAKDLSKIKTDYYNSSNKILFSKDLKENIGYYYKESQLEFTTNNKNYGMSLSFDVPMKGNYDFSTALDLMDKNSTVKLRIMKNNKQIWPQSNDWQTVTGALDDFYGLEFSANAKDNISFDVLPISDSVTFSMGIINIRKILNKTFTELGNTISYIPYDYTTFEKGYCGDFLSFNSRFNYSFYNSSDIILKPSKTDFDNLCISTPLNDKIEFFNDKTGISLTSELENAEISFISPIKSDGFISLNTNGLSENSSLEIYKNNELINNFNNDQELKINISSEINDKFIFKFKNIKGKNIKISNFSISFIAENNNSVHDEFGYYSALESPFSDETYNGVYKKNENEYWNFDILDMKNSEILKSNYYSSDKNKMLFNKDISNTGFYFDCPFLKCNINAKDQTGVALGFVAQNSENLNTRYGLHLETKNTIATICTRLVKIEKNKDKLTPIWPADGWFSQEISSDNDIIIPFINVSLEKGDMLYYEIYSNKSNTEIITLNLSSPSLIYDKKESINNTDLKAGIYKSQNDFTYSYINNYNGKYYNMNNRWNIAFDNITDEKNIVKYLPDTVTTNEPNHTLSLSKYSSVPKFTYNAESGNIDINSYINKTENLSSEIEFICPNSNDIYINGALSLNEISLENALLNYRVIKKNEDETFTKLWPSNNHEFETLSKEHLKSDCKDIEATVKSGEKIYFEYYWQIDNDTIEKYLNDNSLMYYSPTFSVAPSITSIEYVNEERTNFSANSQFMKDVLLNPYWKVQYSFNSENPEWKYATLYQWTYWMSTERNYTGIASSGKYWIQNFKNSYDDIKSPSVAWLFGVRKDGTLTMSSSKTLSIPKNSAEGVDALIRITKNGKKIWPQSDWYSIKQGEKFNFSNVSFDVEKGDLLRFEMKSSRPLVSDSDTINEQLFLMWDPTFTIKAEKEYYIKSKDVYNMLDEKTLVMFKSMDSSKEFDENLSENKILSEIIKNYKTQYIKTYQNKPENNLSKYFETTKIIPGDYKEWSEDVTIKGGKQKRIIKTITKNWPAIIAIISGSSVLLLGGILVTIILIKRKKRNRISIK